MLSGGLPLTLPLEEWVGHCRDLTGPGRGEVGGGGHCTASLKVAIH